MKSFHGLQSLILVVEDEKVIRESLCEVLTYYGYISASVQHGRDAVRYLVRCEENLDIYPSLILLDLRMPEMNGFEFLELYQQNLKWNRIPVIVLSAEEGFEQKLENLAVSDTLSKPFKILDLMEKVRRLLALSCAGGTYS